MEDEGAQHTDVQIQGSQEGEMITVSQDVDAHLFYEVDWSDWLASKGFVADAIRASHGSSLLVRSP